MVGEGWGEKAEQLLRINYALVCGESRRYSECLANLLNWGNTYTFFSRIRVPWEYFSGVNKYKPSLSDDRVRLSCLPPPLKSRNHFSSWTALSSEKVMQWPCNILTYFNRKEYRLNISSNNNSASST